MAKRKRKYNYNDDYFNVIDTEEKAYWLGFLYADGGITRFYKKNGDLRSMSLEIGLCSDDCEHLEKFKKAINANIPIQSRIINNKYRSNRIVINSTKMCEDLIKLGCTPAKSLTVVFPSSNILQDKYIHDFIRGYFDGDGGVFYREYDCFHKQKEKTYHQFTYTCYFCGNKNFMRSIKDILENNNIKVSDLCYDNRSNAVEIWLHGIDNINKFRNFIYKDGCVCLSRKYNKFLDIENNKELYINREKVRPV